VTQLSQAIKDPGTTFVGVSTKMYLGYRDSLRWLDELRQQVDTRPALVAGRVDRVGPDELARERDDGRVRHYFGRICVAMAPAARPARGRRRVRPVASSAPSPVSARTYSSW